MLMDYVRRNSVLREYLHRFDERQWQEVVKLTLILGVQSLKLNEYEMQMLTVEKLVQFCAQGTAFTSMNEALPGLQNTLAEVQNKISALNGELENRKLKNSEVEQKPVTACNDQTTSDVAIGSINKPKPRKASYYKEARSQYSRQTVHGLNDPSGSVKLALSDPITEKPAVKRPKSAKVRRPPRLAYSVPSKSPQTAYTDLTTSHYIDVPPTFRDIRRATPSACNEEMVPVKQSPQLPLNSNSSLQKKELSNNRKIPAYLRHIGSSIKDTVRKDRENAARYRRSRRDSIYEVTRFKSDDKRGNLDRDVHRNEEKSVLQIAEQFLSNPLMKAISGSNHDYDEYNFQAQPRSNGENSRSRHWQQSSHQPVIRDAPESVDELAYILRSWVKTEEGPPTQPKTPDDGILASLKKTSEQIMSESPGKTPWCSNLPSHAQRRSSQVYWSLPVESDAFDHCSNNVQERFTNLVPERSWEFSAEVFE
uniref:Uncharacterized protein n=1 Tax=Spongospora subterranea TaxID=70186 RepID=A0A0H5RB11_9EUKA|eukprot:CRZ10802.1 hypothetical protein [Spongospora subterranea]